MAKLSALRMSLRLRWVKRRPRFKLFITCLSRVFTSRVHVNDAIYDAGGAREDWSRGPIIGSREGR